MFMRKKQITNRVAQMFYKPVKKTNNKTDDTDENKDIGFIKDLEKIDEELDKRLGSIFGKRRRSKP
jgi:hypothetical protein